MGGFRAPHFFSREVLWVSRFGNCSLNYATSCLGGRSNSALRDGVTQPGLPHPRRDRVDEDSELSQIKSRTPGVTRGFFRYKEWS